MPTPTPTHNLTHYFTDEQLISELRSKRDVLEEQLKAATETLHYAIYMAQPFRVGSPAKDRYGRTVTIESYEIGPTGAIRWAVRRQLKSGLTAKRTTTEYNLYPLTEPDPGKPGMRPWNNPNRPSGPRPI